MSPKQDIERLRRQLDELAEAGDDDLDRYALRHPRLPPGFYWQVRWLAGRVLRWLESIGLKAPDPWPAGLKQVRGSERARPLLVWAVGTDKDTLRASCKVLADVLGTVPGFAVVLVTDVADFAFFSRLGWLVEYLPAIAGEGDAYADRKARFLARLYRGAPALPVSAILDPGSKEELRGWLEGGTDVPASPSCEPA